ncbi:hypothetical protein J2Z48_001181 [Croceifilum oryzae]|uniref:Uncharacterized protein n=1 Tax=Croceifilum oryzae TaxID=1553429 RepID=A0AAJ1TEP0_9BACL|nr:hypothetical protein [Croceifilum oryzae]MDQ0417009.1 hypothetical protein [Croceifilum oryzae]
MSIMASIWILFLIQIILMVLMIDLSNRVDRFSLRKRALRRLLRSNLHTVVNIMTDAGVVTGVLQQVGYDGIQLEESNGDLVMVPILSIRAILS